MIISWQLVTTSECTVSPLPFTVTNIRPSESIIKGATTGTGMTQFGRAMHELNIDIICANSSQAKGRVERANKTLQDRLVKELRLQGISTH